jgi:radical SAM protein with 4Fe4S-binding SPASM domain
MGFEGFPFIIGWELTLACNLRCRHCGSSAGLPRDKELTLEQALDICDQFPALLVQEVDFTGGEPLLYPDWFQLAIYLKKLGIKTKILSNGLVLDATIVAQLKEAGISSVGVSLDGLESTHDYIRGRTGAFRGALSGMGKVIDAGIPLCVITTVNSQNAQELSELLDLLISLKVSRWQIQPIAPLGRSRDDLKLCLTEQAYMRVGTFLHSSRPTAEKSGLNIGPADSLGYFTGLDQQDPPWEGCSAGLVSCGITSDAKVKGCLSLPDELIEGDLRKNDLWDIWFDPDKFAYTRCFNKEKTGTYCHLCDKAEQCQGGCTAMSYATTGNFHNDKYCFYGIANRGPDNRLT